MGTTDDATDDTGAQADATTFRVEGLEVRDSGRVRIPHRLREIHDVDEDTVVDIRVFTDHDAFWSPDRFVDDRGRVSIPRNQRDLYDIAEGDTVTMDVLVTGEAPDDGE